MKLGDTDNGDSNSWGSQKGSHEERTGRQSPLSDSHHPRAIEGNVEAPRGGVPPGADRLVAPKKEPSKTHTKPRNQIAWTQST